MENLQQINDLKAGATSRRLVKYNVRVRLDSLGGSNTGKIQITGGNFELKDISVYGYSVFSKVATPTAQTIQNGYNFSIYDANGISKERYTLQVTDVQSGQKFFNSAVNVSEFAPSKERKHLENMFFKNQSVIEFELKHDVVTSAINNDYNIYSTIDETTLAANQVTAPPVELDVVLTGTLYFNN